VLCQPPAKEQVNQNIPFELAGEPVKPGGSTAKARLLLAGDHAMVIDAFKSYWNRSFSGF
jgi:hypothetical protein